jgi:hypothetical protein
MMTKMDDFGKDKGRMKKKGGKRAPKGEFGDGKAPF